MPTYISLIRHGETDWNAAGKFQGHACVPLNDKGQRQATRLAEHLAATAQDVTSLYASDSLRTRQTAEAVATQLALPSNLDERLREIDLGEWQGLTRDEAQQWDAKRFQSIMADPFNNARPGGESGLQVARRALAALESIAVANPDQYVLAITHGGTIRNLLDYLGIKNTKDHIFNTSITRLGHDPALTESPWLLVAFNQIAHLASTGMAQVSGDQEV